MATDIQTIGQLLDTSLVPQQNKEGEYVYTYGLVMALFAY